VKDNIPGAIHQVQQIAPIGVGGIAARWLRWLRRGLYIAGRPVAPGHRAGRIAE